MRVCKVYSEGLNPILGGGIASVIKHIVEETKDKIEYSLLTTAREHDPSIRVEFVKSSHLFVRAWQYLKYVLEERFDIVHFHDCPIGRDYLSAFGSSLTSTPVYSFHSINFFLRARRFRWADIAFKSLLKIWKKIVVPSKYMETDLRRFGYPLGSSKIEVIPNGVDVSEFQRAESIKIAGDPSFLFLGHLEYRKGVDILLRSFEKLLSTANSANSHLHLVGSGNLQIFCREFVSQANIKDHVHFWGPVSEQTKRILLKSCDVCVFPSRYEPFGIVILEGMAAGKPIISTQVGGIPEILKNGRNGLLVAPKIESLHKAMRYIVKAEDFRKSVGRNNLRDVNKFSWKQLSKRYVEMYKNLLYA